MEEDVEERIRMTLSFGTVNRRNFVLLIKIGSKKDREGKDNFALGHPGLVLIITWIDYQSQTSAFAVTAGNRNGLFFSNT